MEQEENIIDETIDNEINEEISDNGETEKTRKNNELLEKLRSIVFEDREVENPNKRKLKFLEQIDPSENVYKVELDYFENVIKEGNIIDAKVMNTLVEAVAIAFSEAINANNILVKNKLSSVYVGNNFISTFHLENILDKLTNQVNKVVRFDSNGYLKIGKFNIENTNVTIDISSTKDKARYAKLVISCNDGLINDAVVYNDDDNFITPKLFINPSVEDDQTIEVFFKPEYLSENIIEIKSSGISEVITDISTVNGVTDVCKFVSELPETAIMNPTNITYKCLEKIKTEIENMKNGTSVFTLLKANTVDLID